MLADHFGIINALSIILILSLLIAFFCYRFRKSKLFEYLNYSVNSEADRFQRLMRKRGWKNIPYQHCRKIVKKYPESAFVIGDESSYQYMPEYKKGSSKFLALVAGRTHDQRRKILKEFHVQKSFSISLKAFAGVLSFLFLMILISVFFDETQLGRISILLGIFVVLILILLIHNMIKLIRSKGYHWLTINDSLTLFAQVGFKAKKLPPKNAVDTLPNYNDYDVLSLVLLARNLK